MGVTLYCKKTNASVDMTYAGFKRFRQLVSERCGPLWAEHYEKLLTRPEDRPESDEELDAVTLEMIQKRKIPIKIVDFLLQSDGEGGIHYGACQLILRRLEHHEDDPLYGYAGWGGHATKLSDVLRLLYACVNARSDLTWTG